MTNSNGGGRGPLLYIALLIAGIVLGGAGVYFYTARGHGKTGSVPDSGAPVETTRTQKKVAYWQAPMDPTYVRDEPGKSPMGMDLIPVYEGEDDGAEPGTVRIDPVMVQSIGVRTKIVERKPLAKTIRTVGRVDYDEKRVHHVNTKVEGWVDKLYVDTTGQKVKRDDYLLEIYSPKLVATQEEYLLARSFDMDSGGEEGAGVGAGGNAAGDYRRGGDSVLDLAKKRLQLWDVPAHQIKELEESGQVKRTLHIHSPASGVVVKKNVQKGMFVKPGMNLYTIADLSKVWVYADVFEYEMSWISVGQRAEMTLAAYPGRVFKGKISFINPFMEPKTRTVKVRLEFDNPGRKLKPDMYANVILTSRRGKPVVVVPSEAVLLSGERSVVIVSRGKGKFTPREVTLGVEAGGLFEVISGLEEGEEIVTSAHFLIDSESRLKEAISKMLELKKKDANTSSTKVVDHSDMKVVDHSDMKDVDHSGMKDMDHSDMKDMDHSDMKVVDHSDMKEMDHSGMKDMDHSDMKDMDHSGMKDMDHSGMKDMDHSDMKDMDHEGMDGVRK